MNIMRRFMRWAAGKDYIYSPQISSLTEFLGWTPEADPEKLLKKIKGWAYTCIDKNASACAQVPLRLYGITGKVGNETKAQKISDKKQVFLQHKLAERVAGAYELVEIVEHPILDLLKNVNPGENAYDLKIKTFKYLEALGYAYWYMEFGPNDLPMNLWPLFPQAVKIIPKKTIGIDHYEYGSGTDKKVFTPEKIVHFRCPSLTDPILGEGGLKAGEQAVDLYDYMNRGELAGLKNGGRPDVIMEIPVDGFVDTDERKRIESEYRRKYSGVDKAGKFMVLSGGAVLKEVGFAPKDMNYLNGRKSALEEICGVFGVPLSFVKIQEVSRANAWASLDMWMQYTINPKLVMFEQKLNEQFTVKWGDNLFLLFDDPRPVDNEFRLNQISVRLATKYSSINEERAIDGLPPVEWGDAPVQEPNPFEEPEEEEEDDEDDDKKPEKPKDDEKSHQKKTDISTDFTSRIFLTQTTILYKQMLADVTQNLQKYQEANKDLDYKKKELVDDIISTIFDVNKWSAKLEKEMSPFLRGMLIDSMINALERLKPDAVYNASSPHVVRALADRKGKIKSLITSSKNAIRNILSAGIAEGESGGQLIKRIRECFNARFEAERVVRSETIWAHNEGTMQGWIASGVVEAKEWDASEDMRACEACKAMHGKKVQLDSNFFDKGDSVNLGGMNMTFDYEHVKHPPLHPNCRCAIVPVLKK